MPFGTKGAFHNKAEWIVDLTTKVPDQAIHSCKQLRLTPSAISSM